MSDPRAMDSAIKPDTTDSAASLLGAGDGPKQETTFKKTASQDEDLTNITQLSENSMSESDLNTTQNTSQNVDSYIDNLLTEIQNDANDELKDALGSDSSVNTKLTDSSKMNSDDILPANGVQEPPDQSLDASKQEVDDPESDGWILVLGHEKLKKKVLTAGSGITTRPQNGQVVTVRYSARLEDGTEVDKHDGNTFPLGDQEVISALELCIALMELHEVCEIYTDAQYAYGVKGQEPEIPPNAALTYTAELLVVEDAPDYSTLPVSLRVSQADKKRLKGNELYSRAEYSASINIYTKALSILDDSDESHSGSVEELQSLVDTRLKCYNNLAAAQLKVEAWDAAIKSSDEVLKVQPENVKALYRKGKCLASKGELESAITLLRKALKLEPETKIIHQELSRLVFKFKSQENSARAMYQKMLGTDKATPTANSKKDEQRSYWWMVIGGATVAAVLSAGIAAYRYVHV